MALAGDATIPHWVNFQESPFAHAQTFALWIEDHGGDNPGFTAGLDDFPDLYRHSPGNTRMLNVSRFACDSVVSSMTKWLSLVPLPETVQTGLAKLGLDASKVGRSALANHEQLVREMIVFVTMHEMGHATGGRHHHVEDVVRGQIDNENDPFFPDDLEQATYSSGDHSCPMRYWHFGSDKTDTLLFLSGRWDPSAGAPGGGAWKFCADDWPQMSLKP